MLLISLLPHNLISVTNTVYQIETEETSSPECILCEQLVKDVEKKISKDKSKVCLHSSLDNYFQMFFFLHSICFLFSN